MARNLIEPTNGDSTIDGFCKKMGWSRNLFYTEQKKGTGPKVTYVGNKPFVLKEHEEEFRARLLGKVS